MRKTFQIIIVMYIHEYKQISLEIIFCFIPVLEIEPRPYTHETTTIPLSYTHSQKRTLGMLSKY